MQIIWTFWTKPYLAKEGFSWSSHLHYLLSWVLSVETARTYYSNTCLFTDDEGARILIDGIGLEFETVSTKLNSLKRYPPQWWAFGKLHTYRYQTEPFIHIDNDVYLWKTLPSRLVHAPLLAQNPEDFEVGNSWYEPDKFDNVNKIKGWLPEEVVWYREFSRHQRAVCCGIFGGNRIDFIQHYAEQSIKLLTHPGNLHVCSYLGQDNILVEQYILSACIEYHKHRSSSDFNGIHIEYLFETAEEAFTPELAKKAGYTHLIGKSKMNPHLTERLIKRVYCDYPEYFDRCLRYAHDQKKGGHSGYALISAGTRF